MNDYKSNILINLKKEFNEDINNIIGLDKCLINGSFVKYGVSKACDVDCDEQIKISVETFKKYIEKIVNNKKILVLECIFRIPHELFESLYYKLGYTDGLFNIHYNNDDTESIREYISKIPDKNIQNEIENLFNEFIENKTLQNLINIKSYIRKFIFAKWTIEELLKGEKKYFDKTYTIEDGIKTEKFRIEIIYLDKPFEFMSISNNIRFKKEIKTTSSPFITVFISNNKINYYSLCKRLMIIIKKIYYTIKNYKLKKFLMRKYDEIYNLRESNGYLNHSMCINKNKEYYYNFIYEQTKEVKYKESSEKYKYAYENDFNKLNNLFKYKYQYWIKGIEPFLKESVRYV